MSRPYAIKPNPGFDRTWDRERWKRESRMCRQFMRMMDPYLPEIERQAKEAFTNLVLYGRAFVRVKP